MRLRKAAAADQRAIRALIHQVNINPLGLDWRRFWVMVDEHDQVIGAGQIKPHGDGSRELASIAVNPAWQNQGIGHILVQHLLTLAQSRPQQPLYLTCREEMQPFYRRFGFSLAPDQHLPPYFHRIARLMRTLRRIFPALHGPVIMVKEFGDSDPTA
jgi:N-acetylglutamate synthase-like GNAT family acetyltransferase